MSKREMIYPIVCAILFGIMLGIGICGIVLSEATAEDTETYSCWVLCRPETGGVLVRDKPQKKSAEVALVDCGRCLETDQREKNGYVHVFGLAAEEDSGWISARYVLWSEPKQINKKMLVRADGRVACRKWIGGPVTDWAEEWDEVYVYWMNCEWAVTERGYIQSQYLD